MKVFLKFLLIFFITNFLYFSLLLKLFPSFLFKHISFFMIIYILFLVFIYAYFQIKEEENQQKKLTVKKNEKERKERKEINPNNNIFNFFKEYEKNLKYYWEEGNVPIINRRTKDVNLFNDNKSYNISKNRFWEIEVRLKKISDYCFLRENGKEYYESIFDYIRNKEPNHLIENNNINKLINITSINLNNFDLPDKINFIEYLSLKEISFEVIKIKQKAQKLKIKEEEEKNSKISLENWILISKLIKFEIEERNNKSFSQGIYLIHCIPINQFYIGSSEDMLKRKNQHISMLRNKSHHSYRLQSAFDKYGEYNLKFYVLEIIELNNEVVNNSRIRKQVEQYYIDKYNPNLNIEQDAFGKKHYRY